jgi:hypothetical protein
MSIIEVLVNAFSGIFALGGIAWIVSMFLKINKALGNIEARLTSLEKNLDRLTCKEHQKEMNILKVDIAIIKRILKFNN